jgi:hypothetical protein
MHIKVELALEVVRAELPEMCFVPNDDTRLADVMETRPAGKQCVDDRGDVLEVLQEEFFLELQV